RFYEPGFPEASCQRTPARKGEALNGPASGNVRKSCEIRGWSTQKALSNYNVPQCGWSLVWVGTRVGTRLALPPNPRRWTAYLKGSLHGSPKGIYAVTAATASGISTRRREREHGSGREDRGPKPSRARDDLDLWRGGGPARGDPALRRH